MAHVKLTLSNCIAAYIERGRAWLRVIEHDGEARETEIGMDKLVELARLVMTVGDGKDRRVAMVRRGKKGSERKAGEHLFVECGGIPRCSTCGADEDDAFIGGEPCTYTPARRRGPVKKLGRGG